MSTPPSDKSGAPATAPRPYQPPTPDTPPAADPPRPADARPSAPPAPDPPRPADARPSAPSPAAVARPTLQPFPPLHGPWPSAAPWGRRWSGATRSAGAPALAAIGAAAVVAALSLPLDRAGMGWLITALAGTAALIVARTAGGRPAPGAPPPLVVRPAPRADPGRFGWAAATVALLAVGTFRSAGWLFALCLMTATLTGALAVVGGRSLRGIAAGYLMLPFAALRSIRWLSLGLAGIRRPADTAAGIRIAGTVATSIALLTVFGTLFASADAAFADVLARITPDIDVPTTVRWAFIFMVTTLALGGAAFLRAGPPDLSGLDAEGRKVNRYEWVVPLGLLVALFAGFVAVQLAVLFGGERHVLETDGLTYAEYARGGFWQLSFATGLTLVVLAGAALWAPRQKASDRVLIRAILGTLAALTLVIVASALHRMNLYADTYGLTRLRVLVACCEAWFGLVLLLVLGAGVRIRAPWLPRVAIAAGVLALFGLAVANPDGLIASHNIQQNRRVDLDYLGGLSPDAVPALAELPPDRRGCVFGRIAQGMEPDDWRGWNLGRERAREIITANPPGPSWVCS